MYSPLISPLKRLPYFIPFSPHLKSQNLFTIKTKPPPIKDKSSISRNSNHFFNSLSKSPSSYIKTKSLILNYIKQPPKDEKLCKDFIQKTNINKLIFLHKKKKILNNPLYKLNEIQNKARFNSNQETTKIKPYKDKRLFIKEHIGLPKYEDSATQTKNNNNNIIMSHKACLENKIDVFHNDFIKYKLKHNINEEDNGSVIDTITAYFQGNDNKALVTSKSMEDNVVKKSKKKKLKLIPLTYRQE